MRQCLDENALDLMFRKARTQNDWLPLPDESKVLEAIWDDARMGPTSANCSPARMVFVTTKAAKEKLRPSLMEGNVEKVMDAPVTVIIGYDTAFYEKLPVLFPHTDAKSCFIGNDDLIQETAFWNGTLQAAYLMLAARAHGLDCGPMSGFENEQVDDIFFKGTTIRSNFICSLGYGSDKKLYPRGPRLSFAEACRVE